MIAAGTAGCNVFVRNACELSGRPYALQIAPRWMLFLMGIFVPVVRENLEMLYQFEYESASTAARRSGRWDSRPPATAKAFRQR
jgi:hypothetical protein